MGNVLKADASFADAWVEEDLVSGQPEVWVTFGVYLPATAVMLWTSSRNYVQLLDLAGTSDADNLWLVDPSAYDVVWYGYDYPPEGGNTPGPDSDAWHAFEFHYQNGGLSEFYIDGPAVWSVAAVLAENVTQIRLGAFNASPPGAAVYYRDVKVGTTRGGSDLFSDDFSSGNLSAWTSTSGDVSVVYDPFVPPVPPPARTCRNVPARFLVTDLDTVATTWLDNLSLGATLTQNLLQPATIDIPVRSNDPRVNTIFTDGDPLLAQSNRLVYAFFRTGGTPAWECVGAGIAMSPQDQADPDVPVTHMVFYDPWQYLLGRPCFADTSGTVIGPNGLLFPATEMGVIAATLLKNTIESESLGTFIDAGTSYGGTGFWGGVIESTPVVDYTVQQGQMVGDAWNQIVALQDPSGSTNGCDIVLAPIYDPANRPGYTHELSIYNLAGRDVHASPIAWGEFVRSTTTADRQHDGTPGQFVNVADFHVGQGGYPVPAGGPPPENAASVALYRTYWESEFFPQQVSPPAVLALALQELQLRKQGKRTFTVTPDPLRSGTPLVDYQAGDRINLNMPPALRVKATGQQRIQTIVTDVNPDGLTRCQQLLTSPDWRGV
jgi:hypothetical protein